MKCTLYHQELTAMKTCIFYLSLLLLSCFVSFSQNKAYKDPHRPQFHFSPPAHWMNDPNGMVYYKGEYHLFYQYYPDSTVWGPMHWGHAISKDLIHWQHLPIALYPDSLGYIFSGSVVVDKNNTTGFQKGTESPLVAIYTYHNMAGEKSGKIDFQTQGIAYSIDKGRTWKKYANNPVIKNPGLKDFRDPKVMWHEPSKHWVMTMAAGNEIRFYRSTDLKNWELSGSFGKDEGSHGGVWECPDLFEMKTGKGKETKWVLLVSIGSGAPNGGSGTQYFTGKFDGKTFTNENPKQTLLWLDYGTDNYAGVTWSNAPDNRRLFLGWMSNWQYAQNVPTKAWRSAMTLPRELSLRETLKGYRLFTAPANEVNALRIDGSAKNFTAGKNYGYSLSEIVLEYDLAKQGSNDFGIELVNSKNESLRVGYDKQKNEFYIDRTHFSNMSFSKEFPAIHTAPRLIDSKKMTLHLFIDHSSVELLADDGTVVMTDIFFPAEDFNKIRSFEKNGVSLLTNGKLYELKSIW